MLTFPSYPVFLVQGDIWDPESTRVGSQAEVGIWYWFGPTRLGAGIDYGSESVPSRSRGNTNPIPCSWGQQSSCIPPEPQM